MRNSAFFLPAFFLLPALMQGQYYYGSGAAAEFGIAVFYADYMHGRRTALDEVYRMEEYTCAHKTHPKGTLLKVTRLDNNQSVVVRVNDRGPSDQDVVVDLSRAAALQIGLVRDGRARVKVEPIGSSATNPGPDNTNRGLAARGLPGGNAPSPSAYSYSDASATGGPGAAIGILPSNSTGYAVQLGSYLSMENAMRQASELQARGIGNLYIWQRQGMNKVVVATFSSRAGAQDYLSSLRSQYMMDGLVVLLR